MTSVLRFLHYHKLVYITRGGKVLDEGADMLHSDNIGILTPMGLLVQEAIVSAKLSPWSAILFVVGAINGHGEKSLILANILDAVTKDPSAMYPVNNNTGSKHRALDSTLVVSTAKGVSEHLTLYKIFETAKSIPSDANDDFEKKTGMSRNFWNNIIDAADDRMSRHLIRDIKDKVGSADPSIAHYAKAYADLKEENELLKVIYVSRKYHAIEGTNGNFTFLGKKKCNIKIKDDLTKQPPTGSYFVEAFTSMSPKESSEVFASITTPF